MNREEIFGVLRGYVAEELLEGDADDLDASTQLLALGVLNSLEVARLMTFIRRKLGLTVPLDSIRVENLVTLSAITEMVHGVASRAELGSRS